MKTKFEKQSQHRNKKKIQRKNSHYVVRTLYGIDITANAKQTIFDLFLIITCACPEGTPERLRAYEVMRKASKLVGGLV